MPKYMIIILLLSNLRVNLGTVLRGTRAQDGQFPWLIQFHTIAPCGGVLVSPDWVLTAAQCVQYKRNSIVVYATGLNGTGSSQTVSVKATYIFPQFQAYSKSRDYDHNIALLKLQRSFDMCDGTIRLLDIAPVRLDDDYKSCLIFGWQSTVVPPSWKVHAKPVQYSKVMLNSWRVCMYMHEGNASYKNVFCTMIEDENGVRACAGNPGSPVVCEDQYERMVLLGIASWSNFSLDCGGLPTYLGVSVFRSWMWDLIFGNKNMEQWESGTEASAVGACRKERRSGGIRADAKPVDHTQVGFHSGNGEVRRRDDSEGAESRDVAFESFGEVRINDANQISNKRISGVFDGPQSSGRPRPPYVRHPDDYGEIIGPDGPRQASDFNVVRDRDEQLSRYREIGRDTINRGANEPVAITYQPERRTIGRTITDRRGEIFDDFDLIMPDGIENLYRSDATSVIPSHCVVKTLFIFLAHIFNTIIP